MIEESIYQGRYAFRSLVESPLFQEYPFLISARYLLRVCEHAQDLVINGPSEANVEQ